MNSTRYYLSEEDHVHRHEQVEAEMGGGKGCGGTFTAEGPPCGGCIDCVHGMVCYGFEQERAWADRVQAAGLELADHSVLPFYVPPADAPSHDDYGHFCAGEKGPR